MRKKSRQYIRFILTVILCLSLIPSSVLAAEEITPLEEETGITEEELTAEDIAIEDTETDITLEMPAVQEETVQDEETEENSIAQSGTETEEEPSDAGAAEAEGTGIPEEPSDEPFEVLEPAEEETERDAESETEDLLETKLPVEISAATLPYTSIQYKGKRIKPEPVVTAVKKDQEIILEKGVDYTVAYKNNLNAGTASVIVTGIGNYTGTLTETFKIKQVPIQDALIKYTKKVYTGKAITQTQSTVVTASVDKQEQVLVLGTDYKITYENNTKVGTATLTVTGTGNFKGNIIKEYKIIPQTPVVQKISVGTAKFTVQWEEHTVETTGFQIQYCSTEDFSTEKTAVTVRDKTAVLATADQLALGTYYVRCRAYKKVSGINYYSKWTETKSVKLYANMLMVSGTGAKRTVYLHNPKSSVKNPSIAVWSQTRDQDDLQWYDMKKYSDGSWRFSVPLAWLNDYGKCYVHCYSETGFLREKAFTVSESDFNKTKNTVDIGGDGVLSTIYFLHPAKTYKSLQAAVWSEVDGQDDLAWIPLTKKSDGYYSTDSCLSNIMNSGTVHVHLYNNTTFLGATTFKVKFGMEPCSSEEEYIEKIAPAVQRVCKKYGYLPSVLIAQSCLENGFGIPSYWDNPEICGLIYYNNMVGLKSELLSASWEDYTVWGGKSIEKLTPEVYDGQATIITDSFRVYDSIEQSFADYMLFMTYASNYGPGGKPKYGPEVISITDPTRLIKAVAKRGYATGTTYPTSVMRIVNRHNLTKYDDLSNVKPTTYGR